MKLILRATCALAFMAACAVPTQAQTWYTTPSSWYAGAAGGPSLVEIQTDPGNRSRTSTAWKLYGGFRFPNDTGAELLYVDLGSAYADALHHTALTTAKVDARYAAIAAVWSPHITHDLEGSLKLGLAVSMADTKGFTGADYHSVDRTKAPHVYAAAGLALHVLPNLRLTADYDYSRVSYRNQIDGSDLHLKRTVDAGAVMVGFNLSF